MRTTPMQERRSPLGLIAIVLWSCILFSGAFGCGDEVDTVLLPNGYKLQSWRSWEVWVENRDGDRVGDSYYSIALCEAHNDLFFGVYHDTSSTSDQLRLYFIIDTAREKYQPFSNKEKWEQVLRELGGVEQVRLLSPDQLVSRQQATNGRTVVQILAILATVTLFSIALALWGHHRFNAPSRPHRL